MIIEFNTGHHINGSEQLTTPLVALIEAKLSQFERDVTKVQAHLTDVDGPKDGPNDKRCVLEAHLDGMPPVVATNFGNSHQEAVTGAIDKLKAALTTTIGRLRNHS